ncbi:MAG: hypothetical protein L6R40_007950 [Gallowayella cf. fulva]|nr:MAG: hypothetical protein L6R40_007950 [Xanthomendoza cf. fulva]
MKPFTDLTESADEKEDLITEAELDNWLESQNRKDPRTSRYGAQQSASIGREPRPPTRNLPIKYPFRALASYKYNNILLRPGVNAELRDRNFLRIVDIIEDTRSRTVTLRGWVFQRAQYLDGVLEKKRNELCWVLHIDEDDPRDLKVQAMETFPVEDVIRRRKIILTNQPWPKLSFREDTSSLLQDSDEVIRNERILVCRFKYICSYVSADRRDTNSWSERVLQRLRAVDCDKWSGSVDACATDDKGLRQALRGETIPGGAHISQRGPDMQQRPPAFVSSTISMDLTEKASKPDPDTTKSRSNIATRSEWATDDGIKGYTVNNFAPAERSNKRHQASHVGVGYEVPPRPVSMLDELRRKCSVVEMNPATPTPRKNSSPPDLSTKRQYTFGDAFCGAGGMSRAAHQSGLHIKFAFDCNENACKSYGLNFPHADTYCLWADEFVRLPIDCKVDILHLSPPCQFFSDAHTKIGKDDEMNTASLFAVGELLKKSRPRVVTLEQTFGIVLRPRHQGYLNALLQVFTSHGFSVRWRLLHCADYGLPQMRLRTFMIASCPGEPLPNFPPPTHSSSPQTTTLLPWTTITSTLASIPPNAPDHNPHLSRPRRALINPESGNRIARTITCSGGGGAQVHPSGTRDLTVREFASLQGFPLEHVFGREGKRRQIGNAVPPVVGRKVLGGVVGGMERVDGVGRLGG